MESKLANIQSDINRKGDEILNEMAVQGRENKEQHGQTHGSLAELHGKMDLVLSSMKKSNDRPTHALTESDVRRISYGGREVPGAVSVGGSASVRSGVTGVTDSVKSAMESAQTRKLKCDLKATERHNRQLKHAKRDLEQQLSAVSLSEKENAIENGQPVRQDMPERSKKACEVHKERCVLRRIEDRKASARKIGGKKY